MARRPRTIAPELRAELEQSPEGKADLAKKEAERKAALDKLFPEPPDGYALAGYEEAKSDFSTWHQKIKDGRDIRYQRTLNPKKIEKRQKGGRGRVFSNLSDNESSRVTAMVSRNPAKFKVPPKANTDAGRKRAEKQTRWLNQAIPYIEQKSGEPLYRLACDNMVYDGLGAWEIYLDDSYEDIDTDEREGEGPGEYTARRDEQLIESGGNICVRWVDPLALYFDKFGGLKEAWIAESKTARSARRDIQKTYGEDELERWQEREKYRPGTPVGETTEAGSGGEVEAVRWYDERWCAYFVDGRLVGEVEEHNLPGVPIVLFEGMMAASSNRSERYRGLSSQLHSLELALDDILTVELDNHLTYGRPKVAIASEKDRADMPRNPITKVPIPLDFEDPDSVPRLEPGEMPVDVTQGFQPRDTNSSQQMWLNLWQRSSLNPIAQGESPGADPAGYTVNSLTAGAQNNYEVLCDNIARALEYFGNFIRLMVRDTIGMPVFFAAPMSNAKQGGTEWLGLAPDDVDETPCRVTIDPMSDVNRLALQQSLRQGNKEGYVTRRRVQELGYAIEDPDAEDKQLIFEAAQQQMAARVIADVDADLTMAQTVQQTPPSTLIDPATEQPFPPSGGANGATPAAPQAPTVGGDMAAASQPFEVQPGPARASSSRANAGQGQGMLVSR